MISGVWEKEEKKSVVKLGKDEGEECRWIRVGKEKSQREEQRPEE